MKRKWQTAVFILLIGILSFLYLRLNDLFFRPEEVFWACERGLRSGPSEEIIFSFDLQEGGFALVGRQKEGLFVVPVERSHLFLWRMKQGKVDGFLDCGDTLGGYLTYDGNFLGLCQEKEIVEISLIFGNWEKMNWKEYVYPVEGELIFIEGEQIFRDEGVDEMEYDISYIEGRNAEGEVVYRVGDEDLAEALRNGNI